MKNRHFFAGGLLAMAALLVGCTTAGSLPEEATCGADYHCIKNLMFQYRQQAGQLNSMAERYAREAEAKATELGQNSDEARKSHEMAMKLWSQAQEADRLAHEYQSRLPHNVY